MNFSSMLNTAPGDSSTSTPDWHRSPSPAAFPPGEDTRAQPEDLGGQPISRRTTTSVNDSEPEESEPDTLVLAGAQSLPLTATQGRRTNLSALLHNGAPPAIVGPVPTIISPETRLPQHASNNPPSRSFANPTSNGPILPIPTVSISSAPNLPATGARHRPLSATASASSDPVIPESDDDQDADGEAEDVDADGEDDDTDPVGAPAAAVSTSGQHGTVEQGDEDAEVDVMQVDGEETATTLPSPLKVGSTSSFSPLLLFWVTRLTYAVAPSQLKPLAPTRPEAARPPKKGANKARATKKARTALSNGTSPAPSPGPSGLSYEIGVSSSTSGSDTESQPTSAKPSSSRRVNGGSSHTFPQASTSTASSAGNSPLHEPAPFAAVKTELPTSIKLSAPFESYTPYRLSDSEDEREKDAPAMHWRNRKGKGRVKEVKDVEEEEDDRLYCVCKELYDAEVSLWMRMASYLER